MPDKSDRMPSAEHARAPVVDPGQSNPAAAQVTPQIRRDGLTELIERMTAGAVMPPSDSTSNEDGSSTVLQRRHADILGDARLRHPIYLQRRAEMFLQLQRTHGNAHVGEVVSLLQEQPRAQAALIQRYHSHEANSVQTFQDTATQSPDRDIPATIRVFDDTASHRAAFRLGAHAFSWRGDIFLGSGLGQPGAPIRSEAIRHEQIHALQARNPGPPVQERELEREAHDPSTRYPALTADPDTVLGLWWVVPVVVGVYILLRPKTANAPGPNDPVYKSPSDAQIVGESLALFAVPAGVVGGLGRLGFGVVSSFALSGAAASVSYRGVQDVGAGQFSGVEAYVIDATTGAVIGIVVGGIFRPFIGATGVPRPNPALIHLTDTAGQTGTEASGVLRGSQGIYAVPSNVAGEGTAMRFLRTLLRPSQTQSVISIPESAGGLFSRPLPVGPVSSYQRLMGVYRAPAGSINMATGGFSASGNALANITGQFWPYGVDGLIWASAAVTGSALSPARPGAYDRGLYSPLYNLVRDRPPLSMTERSDGPFVFVNNPPGTGLAMGTGFDPSGGLSSSVAPGGSAGLYTPSSPEPLFTPDPLVSMDFGAPRLPAVIFVVPLRQGPVGGMEGGSTLPAP